MRYFSRPALKYYLMFHTMEATTLVLLLLTIVLSLLYCCARFCLPHSYTFRTEIIITFPLFYCHIRRTETVPSFSWRAEKNDAYAADCRGFSGSADPASHRTPCPRHPTSPTGLGLACHRLCPVDPRGPASLHPSYHLKTCQYTPSTFTIKTHRSTPSTFTIKTHRSTPSTFTVKTRQYTPSTFTIKTHRSTPSTFTIKTHQSTPSAEESKTEERTEARSLERNGHVVFLLLCARSLERNGHVVFLLLCARSLERNGHKVPLRVSHSSLISSDRMKPRSGDCAVTVNFLQEAVVLHLSFGSSVNRSQGQGLGTGLSQRMQQAAGQAAAHAAINELKDSFRMSNRH
uniref:(California timema) hypothetical protein n=1 Tax=Timema californicum TaxID=61474 RepID=A0A7R9J8V3_TIMCA|nr:unnamed protein product [Timema californicum]